MAIVNKNGKTIKTYRSFKRYVESNKVDPICEMVDYDDGDRLNTVCINTRFNGLGCGFKTIVTCEENNDCIYHGEIRDCNGEIEAIALHVIIKNAIEAGEEIPE